jgi:hypothetical protein
MDPKLTTLALNTVLVRKLDPKLLTVLNPARNTLLVLRYMDLARNPPMDLARKQPMDLNRTQVMVQDPNINRTDLKHLMDLKHMDHNLMDLKHQVGLNLTLQLLLLPRLL